jgi:hypothetical protein
MLLIRLAFSYVVVAGFGWLSVVIVPKLFPIGNPPDANPRYFPKGIFGQKFSQFTTL